MNSGRNVVQKIFSFLLFLLFVTFLVSGCDKEDNITGGGNGTPGENEIFILASSFSPANRTISVGTTIKWINKASVTHDVISGTPGSPSGAFNSGNMGSNAEFSFTFDQAGMFDYFCSFHAGMTGRITVQ